MTKPIETIIIGGGVSGLACGRTLQDNGHDFILLTEEIGGRMLTSQSHKVNYGASYITEDYEHVIPFMGGGKRIWTHNCYFHDDSKPISFYRWRTLFEIPKLLRLYRIARDFRKRLKRLRKRSLHQSQQEALATDAVLKAYVRKPAVDFVRENGLQYLNHTYFSPLFNSTGFIEYDKCNTFAYLDNLMALICKTYVADHSRCCHLLPNGWAEKIVKCRVTQLHRTTDGLWQVTAGDKTYSAENVVLALPFHNARQLYNVPQPEHNIPIYVLEVEGERNKCCQNKEVVFFQPQEHDITILWKQTTGTDVIFSKVERPELNKYYTKHRVVNTVYWKTAVVLSGTEWFAQKLEKGLYLASDYNICGLEDAYITGVYAANQIIGEY
jgi:hypothetical protein